MRPYSLSMLAFAVVSSVLSSGCELLAPTHALAPPNSLHQTPPVSDLDLSRQAFIRGNYGIAIRHLELALARNPASVAALNGLGASYDQLGRHDVALRYYFQALDLAPESPLTLNNIGYSYYLQGKRKDAARYLELALTHDAAHQTALGNHRRVLELQTPGATAVPTVADTVAADSTDARAIRSSANTEWVATPIPTPVAVPRLSAVPLPAHTEAAASSADVIAAPRIEVSNGNGVQGMAGRIRTYLQHEGSNVVRLTNADRYTYPSSTLYYRAGFELAAQALAARLPGKAVTLTESSALAEHVDVRLVIGRDLVTFDAGRQQGVALVQHD